MSRFARARLEIWVGAITTALVMVAILYASKMGEAGLFTDSEIRELRFPLQLLGLITICLMLHGIVEGALGMWDSAIGWWPKNALARYAIPLAVSGAVGFVMAWEHGLSGDEAVAHVRFAYLLGIVVAAPLFQQSVQASDFTWIRERVQEVRA